MTDDGGNGDDAPPKGLGYGNPPAATRFKPGKSGNPRGRPQGAKNIATLFDKELGTKIAVTVNGKRKNITKREALVAQTVNSAVRGDAKAIATVLAETRPRESAAAAKVTEENPYTAQEREVKDAFLERVKRLVLQEPDKTAGAEDSTDEKGASDGNNEKS